MKAKIFLSILLLNTLFANAQEKDFNKKSNTKENSETQFNKSIVKESKAKSLDTGMQLFEKDNYSIQYPKKWKMESPGPFGEPFCLMGPKEEEYVYINLIQEEESKQWLGKNFDKYIENQVNQLGAGSSKVTKTEKIENNRYKIEFDTVIDDEILKSIRYFYLTDKDIYLLTFCARDNFFNAYLQQGDATIKTFKINNQLMNVK